MEIHEVANIFPMMGPDQFTELVNDIKQNGLREPIWTYQGKIIDGRNRFKACQESGIEPRFKEWDGNGSLVAFVASMNLHRRHLDASQRAMVGARIKHIFEDDAQERMLSGGHPDINRDQGEKGRSADKAAKLVGSSYSSVSRASAVLRQGIPEIAEAVDSGEVTVWNADKIVRLPRDRQFEVLKEIKDGNRPSLQLVKSDKPQKSIKQQNEEYLASQTPVFGTPEDLAIKETLNEINTSLGLLVGKLQSQIYSMENIDHIQFVLQNGAEAIRKYANDIDATIKVKRNLRSEKHV